jgi:hypothetical protein
MFMWYQQSAVCYAYLADVEWFSGIDEDECFDRLSWSRWFTRGWTLQELLAPSNVYFFASDWRPLGSKVRFCDIIHDITEISLNAILGQPLHRFNVAQRMSWAAERQTTRIEDRAYSLLGIFAVQMPLLYGEGEHAFVRLQEQILESTEDYSIFVWQIDSPLLSEDGELAFLAPSPAAFREQGTMQHAELHSLVYTRQGWRTNTGQAITGPVDNWQPLTVTPRGIGMQMPVAIVDLYGPALRAFEYVVVASTNTSGEELLCCVRIIRSEITADRISRCPTAPIIMEKANIRITSTERLYAARSTHHSTHSDRGDGQVHCMSAMIHEVLTTFSVDANKSLKDNTVYRKARTWCSICPLTVIGHPKCRHTGPSADEDSDFGTDSDEVNLFHNDFQVLLTKVVC